MTILGKREIAAIGIVLVLFCGCYTGNVDTYPKDRGPYNPAEIVFISLEGLLSTIATQNTTCSGKVVDEKKQPLSGALIVFRLPRVSRIFITTSRQDGRFSLHMKSIPDRGLNVQVTALAKFHGRAETMTGWESCDNLMLELHTLVEEEWHAFRDNYVIPAIRSSQGPVWDLSHEDRAALNDFAHSIQ